MISRRRNRERNIAAGFHVTTRGRGNPPRSQTTLLKQHACGSATLFAPIASRNIAPAFRYRARPEVGEVGGCHGSWVVVMAPRYSDPDHHFDMAAWRPSRLILPSEVRSERGKARN